MFQTKNFTTIVLGMINRAKALQSKITDFRVGSVARTMFESPAAEIDELYQQMWIGLKEAIPVAIYDSFNFTRLPAQPASGLVRVSAALTAEDVVISAGAIFSVPGSSLTYSTQQEFVIVAGTVFVDVFVIAVVPGEVGNIAAGSQFTVLPAVTGMTGAESLFRFYSGSDLETDALRKTRFSAYILTLNRGTVTALKYGLSLATVLDPSGNVSERVLFSQIIEPYLTDITQPVGLVHTYIHNGGDGASTALIADAVKRMTGYTDASGPVSGWKAAGVNVTVEAAANVTVAITGVITVESGYADAPILVAVEAACDDYIAALDIGGDVLCAELVAAVMGVSGVFNFSLTAPTADVSILNTQKAAVGTFTLTVAT